VSTDAGPRPAVDLSGDADPSQGAAAERAGGASVAGAHAGADQVTTVPAGEHDVRPTVQPQTLRPSAAPVGAAGGAGSGGSAGGASTPAGVSAIPPDLLAQFDATATPALSAQVQTHTAAYAEQQTAYERSATDTQEDGHRQLAEADAATRREQEGLRAEVQSDVAGERERWREENRKITEGFGSKAGARRAAVEQEIDTKVQSTHEEAAEKLASAEQEATAAKARAETEAEAKKQEEKKKPKSWWERAKGAISSVFDAIRSAVTAIFDKLRQAVRVIIEAAKSVVVGLIEAARQVVVGLIKGFGEFVKGLVTVALAAFPETAKRARAWIDRRVDQATEAVNRAAEMLKEAAIQILDAVGAALDAALGLLQRGLLVALDAMEFLAKAPFEALELLAKIGRWIEEHTHFLEGAQKMMDDPDSVIEAIRGALGAMIAEAPAKALAALDALAGQLGPKAQKHERGIRRYLSKALDHLREHWWDELKKMGWTLLWPWPAVWKDLKDIWKGIGTCLGAVSHLEISKAIDEFLGIQQKLNSILGAVYGWFFIASVLIGTIIGAFFGGAGAVPGFFAGLAVASEVGEALVVALLATEGAIILKSAADLAIGNDTEDEDEQDYEKIGGSTLTIAITGAMMLLGELAADLAKAIWNGAKGLFKSAGADAAADAAAGATHAGGEAPRAGELPETRATTDAPAGADAPEARTTTDAPAGADAPEARTTDAPADAPEGKAADGADAAGPDAEIINGEKVVASEPTADGHQAKVTEEGTCLICSTCEEVAEMFSSELDADLELKAEFDEIVGEADPKVKAEKLAKFEAKLNDARATAGEAKPGEPGTAEAKLEQLADRTKQAEQGLGRSRELLRDPQVRASLADNGPLKGEIDGELRQLDQDFAEARSNAEAAKELGDPGLIDEAQAKLDEIHRRVDSLEAKINELKGGEAPEATGKVSQGDSPVWKELEPYRGRTKSNGVNGAGRQYYEWDFTHGDIEVYDAGGRHLGSMDPVSGEITKPAVRGRTIDI
jgi:hypothetical protein